MNQRIIGFDLARAYAILGMYIVNFNLVFGNPDNSSWLGSFLGLFNGNSAVLFVLLSGMGVSLMSYKKRDSPEDRKRIRMIILKRSWFLFAFGLLLYLWWPADILHFYGGYMHIAALLLFVSNRKLIIATVSVITIFHIALVFIPYETGWDFDKMEYLDFLTVKGFIRNTLYNGWNSIFPWVAFFLMGMWLGRLNWQRKKIRLQSFISGGMFMLLIALLQYWANHHVTDEELKFYLTAEYIPPFLPFMLSTTGFALMVIPMAMFIGEKCANNQLASALVKTGQMTFSHYVGHLTLGLVIVSLVFDKASIDLQTAQAPLSPALILGISLAIFALSVLFSWLWAKRFSKGPLELLMRRLAG